MVALRKTRLFGLQSPKVNTVTWSGASSIGITGPSDAIDSLAPATTVEITAGAGTTLLAVNVEVTQDKVNWFTAATIYRISAGKTRKTIGLPFVSMRINVSQIAGGGAAVSATATEGQAAVSEGDAGGFVVANPMLCGISEKSRFTLAKWNIPFIKLPSGTIGANGAITLNTALPAVFPQCWGDLPANAIFAGSAAGVYFLSFTSTTVGTVYNNTLGTGSPHANIPVSATPFSGTTGAAYTPNTSIAWATLPVMGVGPDDSLSIKAKVVVPNNANAKTGSYSIGGVQFGTATFASMTYSSFERTMDNLGAVNFQGDFPTGAAAPNDFTQSSVAATGCFNINVNMGVEKDLTMTAFNATATDYQIWFGCTVEIIPGV